MSPVFKPTRDSSEPDGCCSESAVNSRRRTLDQPDTYRYTHGNTGLISPREFANPRWRFFKTDYNLNYDRFFPEDEEEAIEVLIKRILLSSSINRENEDSFGINNPTDGLNNIDFDNRPPVALPKFEKLKWKKKMWKARREWKKDKMPTPEEIGPCGLHLPLHTVKGRFPDGTESVTMPLNLYRQTVLAEIDSFSRRIYNHYIQELQTFDEQRIEAMKDSFLWHEKSKSLEEKLKERDAEIHTLKDELKTIRAQLSGQQELKRQRRAARKRRKKMSQLPQDDIGAPECCSEEDTNNSHVV